MTRPEWVEAVAQALHARYCACGKPDRIERRSAEIAVATLAPLIRADEREQWATHEAVQSSHIGMLLREAAHAEAVAARLVEVICEQEEVIASERMFARAAGKATANLRAQIAADIEAHYTPLNGDVGPSDYDEGLHVAALLARGQCGYVDCMACARIARGDA